MKRYTETAPEPVEDKPELVLSEVNGNAFAICGAARKAAKAAGWKREYMEAIEDEMRSYDYDHLLATAADYFDVS